MTAEQLVEWMAFMKVRPFGALAEDYRFGVLAVAVGNAAGVKTTNNEPLQPAHFYESVAPRYTAEEWSEVQRERDAAKARLEALNFQYQRDSLDEMKEIRKAKQMQRVDGRKPPDISS